MVFRQRRVFAPRFESGGFLQCEHLAPPIIGPLSSSPPLLLPPLPRLLVRSCILRVRVSNFIEFAISRIEATMLFLYIYIGYKLFPFIINSFFFFGFAIPVFVFFFFCFLCFFHSIRFIKIQCTTRFVYLCNPRAISFRIVLSGMLIIILPFYQLLSE